VRADPGFLRIRAETEISEASEIPARSGADIEARALRIDAGAADPSVVARTGSIQRAWRIVRLSV
jgi:hypothetical protein